MLSADGRPSTSTLSLRIPISRLHPKTVLGRMLDRRNFQKRIHDLGIVVRLDELKTGGAHRAPYLYHFDRKRYAHVLKNGL